jgi:hypothetical protein
MSRFNCSLPRLDIGYVRALVAVMIRRLSMVSVAMYLSNLHMSLCASPDDFM